LSEATILELVSAGKVADLFTFKPAGDLAEKIPAADGFTELALISAAAFDSLRQPLLDFAFKPAHRSLAEFDPLGEALLCLQPINHRPT
jgi:hypothetical protein